MRNIITIVLLLFISVAQIAKCQINIGDTLQFWSVSYIDWQPGLIEQRQISAVCLGMGEHCYFFVDTGITNPPTAQQIASVINIYDTSFVPNLTQLYGPVPDEFDNDPRIYILIIPNEGWIGYFDPAHQMANSVVMQMWGKHSNQKEMIYFSHDVFNYGAELVLAHEFGHMLHWGRDHSPEPPDNPVIYWENGWIDESFANFAPVYLIENISLPDVYDNQAFFVYNPDISLINFEGGASYNQVKLWLTFMYEHYGEENFISALINDQANGIKGVINTLDSLGYTESFNETFEQWIVANYLDHLTFNDGKYGYFHYNFPPCKIAASHTQFPTGTKSGSVRSYAADYILFTSTTPRDVNIQFNGVDASEFRLIFLKLGTDNSQIFSAESVTPDSLNYAEFRVDSLGIEVKKLIMIVMNTDTALNEGQKAFYIYGAESTTDTEDEYANTTKFNLEQNYPNPFNPSTRINYTIPEMLFVTIKVYDILGNEIATIVKEEKPAGEYEVTFIASRFTNGVYIYRLQAGDFIQNKKMILLK